MDGFIIHDGQSGTWAADEPAPIHAQPQNEVQQTQCFMVFNAIPIIVLLNLFFGTFRNIMKYNCCLSPKLSARLLNTRLVREHQEEIPFWLKSSVRSAANKVRNVRVVSEFTADNRLFCYQYRSNTGAMPMGDTVTMDDDTDGSSTL